MTSKTSHYRLLQYFFALSIIQTLDWTGALAKTRLSTPTPFPAVQVNGTDGFSFNTVALLDSKKPTVVVYFSPECGACNEQIISITSTMEQMEDVEFLMVTSYEPEETRLFLEAHNVFNHANIKVGYDANLNLNSHYSISAIPSLFLYSAEGELTQEWIGITSTEELTAALTGKPFEPAGDLEKVEECPEPTDDALYRLCRDYYNSLGSYDDVPKYILTLEKLSCAENDPQDIAREKVKKMWNANATRIKCSFDNWSLNDHNILKHAVDMTNDDLIRDLVNIFDADLDFKDPKDGKTALEFCNEELKEYESQPYTEQRHINRVKRLCEFLEEASKRPKS